MYIIDKMEEEALKFMHNRKKIEDRLAEDMKEISNKMQKEIERRIKAEEVISISLLLLFVDNELRPIIEKYKEEQQVLLDSALRDTYDIGIENGQRLLELSNEPVDPYNREIRDSSYEEVLISLLMFGERLVDVLGEDLSNGLKKDLTSIYVTGKNIRNRDNDREINSNNNSTINTIIGGSIISRYINPTFKNITYRAELIARNESNRTLHHGHMMRYMRENIELVKWVEVRDERLCHNCRNAAQGGDLGNGIYYISEIAPPPLHSRCRCILVPYREFWAKTRY